MAVDRESSLYKQAFAEEAAVLGVDPNREPYLIPIVEEALLAEPPHPWKELVDPDSGTPYYLNTVTQESTWDNPALAALKQRIHAARQQQASQAQQQQRQNVPRQNAPPQNSQAVNNDKKQTLPHTQATQARTQQSPATPKAASEPEEDVVEYIVARRPDKRSTTGELEYKVHWRGTDATEDEWFLRGALVNDYPDLLAEYDRKEDARLAKIRADAAKASEAAEAAKAAELAKAAEQKRLKREEESRKVIHSLQREVERLESEADSLRRDLFEVREDRDSLDRKVKRLRQDYDLAESHISKLKGELATESDEATKMRHEIRTLKSDRDRLEREKLKLIADAEIAEQNAAEALEINKVKRDSDERAISEALKAKENELLQANERTAKAEVALHEEISARQEKQRKLEVAEHSLEKLRSALVDEEKKVWSLEAQLAKAKAESDIKKQEDEKKEEATPPPAPQASGGGVPLPPDAVDSIQAEVKARLEAQFEQRWSARENELHRQMEDHQRNAIIKATAESKEKLADAERALEQQRRIADDQSSAIENRLQQECDELRKKVKKLKATNTTLKGVLEDAQREMQERQEKVQTLEVALKKAKEKESSQAEKMQKKMEAFEAEITLESEARIEKHAEAIRAQAKASVDRIQAKLEAVQEKFRSEVATRRKLHERVMELEGNIRVFCRARPVLAVDGSGENAEVVVSCSTLDGEVANSLDSGLPLKMLRLKFDEVTTTRRVDSEFEFEGVFPSGSMQTDVYEKIRPFVISAVDGYDVCLFAYGQTGSGKTFTMEGGGDRLEGGGKSTLRADEGIYARALNTMFTEARSRAQACGTMSYKFQLSMTEIYMEEVFDLLNTPSATSKTGKTGKLNKVELRQKKGGGVYAEGLTRVDVLSSEDVQNVMALGAKSRSVGSHNMNEHSSRSHLVVTVTIIAQSNSSDNNKATGFESAIRNEDSGKPPETGRGLRVSRIHMIDLAGSERVGMTNASGHRLKEAQAINKSLSALGNVICALGKAGGSQSGTGKGHIPFRDSKLTHLLSESLSGTSKVIMMLCVSPTAVCGPETLCSLKFAARCRATKLGRARRKAMKKGNGR